MKKMILMLCLLISVLPCLAGNIFINVGFRTPLFYGFDNPVVAYATGYPNQSIFITVKNGTVEKVIDSLFKVRPDSIKDVIVYLKTKKGNKIITLGMREFHVVKPPEPLVRVAGKTTGAKIEDFILRSNLGISTPFGDGAEDNRYDIASFTLTILKKSGNYFRLGTNEGGDFTPEMKTLIDKAESGDIVMFTSIKAAIRGIKNQLFDLAAVEITVL